MPGPSGSGIPLPAIPPVLLPGSTMPLSFRRLVVALRLSLGALLLCLPLADARAASLEDLIAGLGADGFNSKIEAVQGLGTLGDGRAIAALQALRDGRL